ncbi:hypothetical protein GGU11DRAFT_134308 [Lentinula aff. detonsa]|nr:hypothetical protein GGU11DRAFT_134308 [Lentinula aff. detonsa]
MNYAIYRLYSQITMMPQHCQQSHSTITISDPRGHQMHRPCLNDFHVQRAAASSLSLRISSVQTVNVYLIHKMRLVYAILCHGMFFCFFVTWFCDMVCASRMRVNCIMVMRNISCSLPLSATVYSPRSRQSISSLWRRPIRLAFLTVALFHRAFPDQP